MTNKMETELPKAFQLHSERFKSDGSIRPVDNAKTTHAPSFVISLDFEMFWGVAAFRSLRNYGRNVEGEWRAIPRMLKLFSQNHIRATWATVGMVMCRDHAQWREIRPAPLPSYSRPELSAYCHDVAAREHPRLFFARPLVEQILATPGQELASHTYSHFYCDDQRTTLEQFGADLACARMAALALGAACKTMVFPRNQLRDDYIALLPQNGFRVYRGNPQNWIYRSGDAVPGGLAGRGFRFLDAWLPISGHGLVRPTLRNRLVDLPASAFLRPWSARLGAFEPLRLGRIMRGMTLAAQTGTCFHLWWHPHNFGVNVDENLAVVETLLAHYHVLHDRYGMQSRCMADYASLVAN
jgi:peptidoglycan/xylan/chitin deacetylase (PgdA/CDA1 family)